MITQEVVRHQPVVQTQIQERVVEIPQVQVVQPVITEKIVETRQQEVSYQTAVHQGAAVQRVESRGVVESVGALSAPVAVSAPVATTQVVSAPVESVASYGLVGGAVSTGI